MIKPVILLSGGVIKSAYIKDHPPQNILGVNLGSIRLTMQDNTSSFSVVNASDYAPYGEYMGNSVNTTGRYKFTEKERDVETNYDYFGARYYNNKLGVWLSVDPLAEKYPGFSPYNYTMGNPLRYIDPDGKDIEPHSSARNSKAFNNALNLYLKTELGNKQFNEMQNNHKILIVLAVGDFEKTNANSAAGSTQWIIGSQSAKTVNIENKDMGIAEETFKNDGKQVIFVKISKDALENKKNTFNAETIFHELTAHIEFNLAIGDLLGYKIDPKNAHKQYGTDGSKTPQKGSPAAKFMKQAEWVDDENKK